jgi:ribosomal protein S18 acetylase RimI-like enzyme
MIRRATAADAAQLMELLGELHPSDTPPDNAEFAKALEDMSTTDHLHLLVLLSGPLVVSTCYLAVIPNLTRQLRPFAVVENVVTRSTHRNRGFGTTLIRHALELARSLGCYKVMLLVDRHRPGVISFYEKAGFDSNAKIGLLARRTDPPAGGGGCLPGAISGEDG